MNFVFDVSVIHSDLALSVTAITHCNLSCQCRLHHLLQCQLVDVTPVIHYDLICRGHLWSLL